MLAPTRVWRNYTLGQRGGSHIGGSRAGSGEPWYVAVRHAEEPSDRGGREHPPCAATT